MKQPHEHDGLNPHLVAGEHSPLSALMKVMMMRFGDFSAGESLTITHPMSIHLANAIVDEVNGHPYQDKQIPYYVHVEDTRPIADNVMVAGLLALYAEQQGSKRAPALMAMFYRSMNQTFHRMTLGTGRIVMRPVDSEDSDVLES